MLVVAALSWLAIGALMRKPQSGQEREIDYRLSVFTGWLATGVWIATPGLATFGAFGRLTRGLGSDAALYAITSAFGFVGLGIAAARVLGERTWKSDLNRDGTWIGAGLIVLAILFPWIADSAFPQAPWSLTRDLLAVESGLELLPFGSGIVGFLIGRTAWQIWKDKWLRGVDAIENLRESIEKAMVTGARRVERTWESSTGWLDQRTWEVWIPRALVGFQDRGGHVAESAENGMRRVGDTIVGRASSGAADKALWVQGGRLQAYLAIVLAGAAIVWLIFTLVRGISG
jgi:hypothetical protein